MRSIHFLRALRKSISRTRFSWVMSRKSTEQKSRQSISYVLEVRARILASQEREQG
nr:MAG TPA: hypothetical protein [Caudoviricetes sp.]